MTPTKHQQNSSLPTVSQKERTTSNQSLLRQISFFLITILVCLGSLQNAKAQTDPINQGDLVLGDSGTAPNQNSQFVPGLQMGAVTFGGEGCKQGQAAVSISNDQRLLSVLFDSYVATAGGNSGQVRAAVDCIMNIPFQVPSGYRLQIVKMDYRGFAHVPNGARTTFGAGFRFLEIGGNPTNAPRVMRAKVMVGSFEDSFQLSAMTQGSSVSPCGRSFTIQADTRVLVQTNRANDEVMTSIDSLDVTTHPIEYSLLWERCNQDDSVNPPYPPPRPGPRPYPPPRPRPPIPRPRYF